MDKYTMEEREALIQVLREVIETEQGHVKSWEQECQEMERAHPDDEPGYEVIYLREHQLKLAALRKLEQELKEREING